MLLFPDLSPLAHIITCDARHSRTDHKRLTISDKFHFIHSSVMPIPCVYVCVGDKLDWVCVMLRLWQRTSLHSFARLMKLMSFLIVFQEFTSHSVSSMYVIFTWVFNMNSISYRTIALFYLEDWANNLKNNLFDCPRQPGGWSSCNFSRRGDCKVYRLLSSSVSILAPSSVSVTL